MEYGSYHQYDHDADHCRRCRHNRAAGVRSDRAADRSWSVRSVHGPESLPGRFPGAEPYCGCGIHRGGSPFSYGPDND